MADLAEHGREVNEALAECERELNIRIRMFPEWVQKHKLSAIDAKDRLERMAFACALLEALLNNDAVVLAAARASADRFLKSSISGTAEIDPLEPKPEEKSLI